MALTPGHVTCKENRTYDHQSKKSSSKNRYLVFVENDPNPLNGTGCVAPFSRAADCRPEHRRSPLDLLLPTEALFGKRHDGQD